jgi:hypothetical protein
MTEFDPIEADLELLEKTAIPVDLHDLYYVTASHYGKTRDDVNIWLARKKIEGVLDLVPIAGTQYIYRL